MHVDYNSMTEPDFRRMLRTFIAEECTPNLLNQARRIRWHEARPWCLKLSARGWIAPGWPSEFGGMGLDTGKLLAYYDEFEAAGVARTPDLGFAMLGPLLIRYGTQEQRRRYLPRIVSCDDLWCQGYSEPGAGSDLASLKTTAVLDGEEWVIDGQKIWTTLAQDSTHMFLLARTNPAAKKQQGISFLLASMDSPGITVKPIRTLAGEDEFCEVFFDAVRVPRENVVGDVDQGWPMAKALLGFERLTIGSPKFAHMALLRLEELARQFGAMSDPVFMANLVRLQLDVADLITTYGRFAERIKRGETPGSEMSVLKIWSTETFQRVAEQMVELAGESGVMEGQGAAGVDALAYYFFSRPGTIFAGSNEIQRNIIAKQVLQLV